MAKPGPKISLQQAKIDAAYDVQRGRITDLNKQIGKQISVNNELQEELADVRRENNDYEKQAGVQRVEIDRLREQVGKLLDENKELQEDNAELRRNQIVFNTSRDDHHRLISAYAGKRCPTHERRCAQCATWNLFDDYWSLVSDAGNDVEPKDVKWADDWSKKAKISKLVETRTTWECPHCAEQHESQPPALYMAGTSRCVGCGEEIELVD